MRLLVLILLLSVAGKKLVFLFYSVQFFTIGLSIFRKKIEVMQFLSPFFLGVTQHERPSRHKLCQTYNPLIINYMIIFKLIYI